MSDSLPPESSAAPIAPAAPATAAPQHLAPRQRRTGPARGKTAPKAPTTPTAPTAATPRSAPPPVHPLLELLAQRYPHLFGAQFLPLKRGIFHDITAALGSEVSADDLKLALAQHTRSTRYLSAMASGAQRHDLAGAAVEALAPEHVVHALREVFRRRQQRSREDLTPRLRQRLLEAQSASGLSPQEWGALVRGRDEAAQALIAAVVQDAADRAAKDEALQRAFEASGQSAQDFAAMYGMSVRDVTEALARVQPR